MLGLYSNGWTVNQCAKHFMSLAATAFQKRWLYRIPLISSQLVEVILSFITDSKYGSSGINRALKFAFGERRKLFETSGFGTKLGVRN